MDYNLGNCLINVRTFIGDYAIIAFFFRFSSLASLAWPQPA